MNRRCASLATAALVVACVGWAVPARAISIAHPTARVRLAPATPLAASSSAPCETYPYTDPAHDTVSSIDIVSYTLTYNCVTGVWRADLTAAQPFTDDQVHFLDVEVDTDGKPNDNCGGFEYSEVAQYVPQTHQFASATIQWLGSCDKSNTLIYQPSVDRNDGSRSIAISFTQRPTVWGVGITSFDNATESQFDFLPNSGINRTLVSGSPAFNTSSLPQINGSFTQVVAGDFNGDGRSDLLEYAAGSAPDYVSFSESSDLQSWTTKPVTIGGTYRIIPGDFNGDGKTDLLFYGPGAAPDFVWLGSYTGNFRSVPITINGDYSSIVAGDFNGDGKSDLFFYAAGTATDYLGLSNGDGTFTTTASPTQINSTYQIAAGDIDGDGRSDLVLYAPGLAPDHLLRGQSNGTFVNDSIAINGNYAWLRVGDFNGDGRDDLLLVNPDTPPDTLAFGTASAPFLTAAPPAIVAERYDDAIVGDFTGDGTDDVLFYGSGPMPERTWIGHSAPLNITSPVLPGASPNTPYSFTVTTTRPSALQQWSATGLPAGFSIDPTTGTITGQSNTLLTAAPVTVSVRDNRGRHASRVFRLNVMPGFASLTSNDASSCVLTPAGEPYCWGAGQNGLLSGGATSDALVPVKLTGLSGLQAIEEDGAATCIITAAGAAKCAGTNANGQLGDGKAEASSATPVQVTGLTAGVQAISGGASTCAITAAGAAVCWGQNLHDEIGNGTTTEQDVPAQVTGLTSGVTSISMGGDHACAVKNGNVWCWGSGSTLGDGTGTTSPSPVEVGAPLTNIVSVVAGTSHTCALSSAGAVWCWGHNYSAQLGDGKAGPPALTPVAVVGLDHGVTSLSAGTFDTCATKSDGTVWCWGDFTDPAFDALAKVPVQVQGIAPGATFVATATGFFGAHTCAGSATTMQCWGVESAGELGDGNLSTSIPVGPSEVLFNWN